MLRIGKGWAVNDFPDEVNHEAGRSVLPDVPDARTASRQLSPGGTTPRTPPGVPDADVFRGATPVPPREASVSGTHERVADEAFIRALYAEHGGALLRYALHLTGGDRQRAEDLVQETIVRAWRHPEALADRPARPWLFAVARNLAVDAHRARQSRPQEVGQAVLETLPVADDADRTLDSWAVAEALASLRPDHRKVIVETYYRGCTVAEAATTLGIPAGTVKSRTYYALKALKLALQERGLAP
jgi:RNA polymerase sigma-70 factor, ECF subfamily